MNPGYVWQQQLDRQHAIYAREGRALVVRTSPPNARTKGPVDYIALVKGGVIVLDAKCYRDGFRLSDLPDHQAAYLHNAEQLGHRGGLVMPGVLAWWSDFGPAWRAWRNGGKDGVVTGRAFVGTDWLSIVE